MVVQLLKFRLMILSCSFVPLFLHHYMLSYIYAVVVRYSFDLV